jgi:hypothetical protein
VTALAKANRQRKLPGDGLPGLGPVAQSPGSLRCRFAKTAKSFSTFLDYFVKIS